MWEIDMKKRSSAKILAIAIILTVLLVSCGSPAPVVAPTTQTQIQQPGQPTATSVPRTIEPPTPTPVLFAPGGIGTPLPASSSLINAQTAEGLQLIAVIGHQQPALYLGDGKLKFVDHPGECDLVNNADGTVISSLQFDRLIDYTSDGRNYLVLMGKELRLYSLGDDGKSMVSQETKVDTSTAISARVSPDGKWLVVLSKVPYSSSPISIIPLKDTNASPPTTDWQKGLAYPYPIFSSGGKYLISENMSAPEMTFIRTSDWQKQFVLSVDASPRPGLFQGTTDGVNIQTSPDDTHLAALQNGGLQLWDLTKGKKSGFISIKTDGVGQLKFSPNSQYLAMLLPGKLVTVWNVSSEVVSDHLNTDEITLNNIQITDDGKIQHYTDTEKRPWGSGTIDPQIGFGPDGNLNFTTSGYDAGPHLTRNKNCTLDIVSMNAACADWLVADVSSAYWRKVVKVGSDGQFYTLSLIGNTLSLRPGAGDSGVPLGTTPVQFVAGRVDSIRISALAIIPQQSFLVYEVQDWSNGTNAGFYSQQDVTIARNMANGKQLEDSADLTITGYAASKDGKLVAAYDTKSQTIKLVDLSTFDTQAIGFKDVGVPVLALSPNGKRLAYINEASNIEIGDVSSGQSLATSSLAIQADPNSILIFSPDGNTIALSQADGSIYLFDAATGNVLTQVKSEVAAKGLAFSPDGKVLASVHGSDGIRLWGVIPGVFPPTPKPSPTMAPITPIPVADTPTPSPVPDTATARPVPDLVPGTIELTFGVPQAGKGANIYTFSGTEGQKISIVMNKTAGDSSFPSLNLTDDAGKSLKSDLACCQDAAQPKSWWQTQAAILDFPLPYTGTYFIRTSMVGRAGSYSLQVDLSK